MIRRPYRDGAQPGSLYETPRLIVRHWREDDREPLAAMNADPEVMRFFPSTLTRAESDTFFDRLQTRAAADGFAFPALELKSSGALIGFAGLALARFPARFTPAVEIGWRLARRYWGQGYATEAALAGLEHGFAALGLEEVVSFTANRTCPRARSWRGSACARMSPAASIIRPWMRPRRSSAMCCIGWTGRPMLCGKNNFDGNARGLRWDK
jgi:RimJ/RimL family protein N-acetyltransferase